MTRHLAYATSILALLLSTASSEARLLHAKSAHHHTYREGRGAYHRGPRERVRSIAELNGGRASAASSYMGPGADVFRRTEETAHAPGVTLELDPTIKETATGGPSGGSPNGGTGP